VAGERCIRIDLGYDGRRFFGSQRQPESRTVQWELEDSLEKVTGQSVRLAFAGRTDRGVHAVGQVASGVVFWKKDLERLRFALDSLTDDDLVVYRVFEVDEQFHARYSAVRREYRYRVLASDRAPVLLRGLVWPIHTSIALDRINAASERLIGYQDFRSFAGSGVGSGNSAVDTRRHLDLAEWRELPNHFEPTGQLYEFRVRANAFLPHMVRNLVGALIEVGTGAREPNWIDSLLGERDRKQAPPPAPPNGLTLWSVEYDSRDTEQKPGRNAGLEQE
jgi:tRNA pseudouridine38-40 synthase